MQKHYFTRLTPNFLHWEKPSGQLGKCPTTNQDSPIYEDKYGFGWEEWLLEDYFAQQSNPEFTCNGFIQAFNQKNKNILFIDRLYLYTKVCKNNLGVDSGSYFVGYIDNVKHTDPISKSKAEVLADLNSVGVTDNGYKNMLPFAKNIAFKVKDVHINFQSFFNQPIQLSRGQFRFALYNLNKHSDFLDVIQNYF